MQITRANFTKNGVQKKTKKFYARFYDHNSIRRTLPLFTEHKTSDDAGKAIQRLVNHRASGGDLPPELHRFIENTLPAIKKKLAQWGIVEASRVASAKTLAEHVVGWTCHVRSKGTSDRQIKLLSSRVTRLFKACRFKLWNDINAVAVADQLEEWRVSETKPMSTQTSNFYLQAARQFCKYMVRQVKCASDSPLSELSFLNVNTDRRHDRRAYTVDEFCVLLAYLQSAKTLWNIPALERALIYQFAVVTGLRHGAIEKMTVRSFGEDKGTPAVNVPAGAKNKYKSERWFPMTLAVWAKVEHHIVGKALSDKVFNMPPRSHAAKLVKKDLAGARARWIGDAKDAKERRDREASEFLRYKDEQGRFLDFHSFRHTRGVWLFLYNRASARAVQELLGVSSIALVDRYTKSLKLEDYSIVERGPDLTPTMRPTRRQTADGDPNTGKSFTRSFTQEGGLQRISADSDELDAKLGDADHRVGKNAKSSEEDDVLTKNGESVKLPIPLGEVAEWLNAPVSKTG